MEKNPLVSVLMTAYNRQNFIQEAIESVLGSTYTNFELIITDDGSKDETVRIADSFAKKDNRIRVYVNEKNLGDYPNRNKAASLAKGDLLMFVDSDDKIYSSGIEYCVNGMHSFPNANFGMCYKYPGNQSPFYYDGQKAVRVHFYERQFLAMGPGGTILNRSFFNEIGGYPEKYGPANDMYFNLKAASIDGVVLLPFEYFFHRIHPGQEQNNTLSYLHNNYKYTRDALNDLQLGLTPDEIEYFRKKSDRRFVVNTFTHLKKTGNLKEVKKTWELADFTWKNFLKGVFH